MNHIQVCGYSNTIRCVVWHMKSIMPCSCLSCNQILMHKIWIFRKANELQEQWEKDCQWDLNLVTTCFHYMEKWIIPSLQSSYIVKKKKCFKKYLFKKLKFPVKISEMFWNKKKTYLPKDRILSYTIFIFTCFKYVMLLLTLRFNIFIHHKRLYTEYSEM